MLVADEELRLCESCLTVQPAAEFRLRFAGRDTRLGQCRACHNAAERERRAARRVQRDHAQIGKFANALKRAPRRDTAELLCQAMTQQFGGLVGFASAWVAQGKWACDSRPGGKRALDFFRAVAHLVELCSASVPDLEDLTDDDLERAFRDQMQRLIVAHPELAIEAAEQLGWQVTPN